MTDLDRLLELFLRDDLSYEEKKEKIELKSKLESKLAENKNCLKCNQNPMQIHGWCYACIEDYSKLAESDESKKKIDWYDYIVGKNTTFDKIVEEYQKLLQIQSQHTNLVKAIQDLIHDASIHGEDSDRPNKFKLDASELRLRIYRLQNLLESTGGSKS